MASYLKCPKCSGLLKREKYSSEPEGIRADAYCPVCHRTFAVTKSGLIEIDNDPAREPLEPTPMTAPDATPLSAEERAADQLHRKLNEAAAMFDMFRQEPYFSTEELAELVTLAAQARDTTNWLRAQRDTAEAEVARLNAALEAAGTPDVYGLVNGDATVGADELLLLVEDGEVCEVWRNRHCGNSWIARIPTSDGDYDVEEFATEAEARAALDAAKAKE